MNSVLHSKIPIKKDTHSLKIEINEGSEIRVKRLNR